MKYPKALRPQLLDDTRKIVALFAKNNDLDPRRVPQLLATFQLTREINAQRSYGDDHPRWEIIDRVLPDSHVKTRSWLNELYDVHDLNDDTLRTAANWALQTIAKELSA